MKYLLLLFLIISSPLLFAQNSLRFHHNLWQGRLDDRYFELRTNDVASTLMTIGGTQKLKCLITTDGKGLIAVDFWQIEHTAKHPDPYRGRATIVNSSTQTTKFALTDKRSSLGLPTRVLKAPFRAVLFSVGTTPLRIRPKADSSMSTVSSALSLSLSGGYTWGYSMITGRAMTSYSVTLGPFIGVSTAELKKETVTTPKIWENSKTTTRVLPAFSYGLNVTFARNNFGLVVSGGLDAALGDMADSWSYQNKPWVGLGVNTSLGLLK